MFNKCVLVPLFKCYRRCTLKFALWLFFLQFQCLDHFLNRLEFCQSTLNYMLVMFYMKPCEESLTRLIKRASNFSHNSEYSTISKCHYSKGNVAPIQLSCISPGAVRGCVHKSPGRRARTVTVNTRASTQSSESLRHHDPGPRSVCSTAPGFDLWNLCRVRCLP